MGIEAQIDLDAVTVIPDLDGRTLREVRAILETDPAIGGELEYFTVSPERKYPGTDGGIGPDTPWAEVVDGYRWIASWATIGGSEGWYIHVEAVRPATEGAGQTYVTEGRPLFLAKTFQGYAAAAKIAAIIGARLGAGGW